MAKPTPAPPKGQRTHVYIDPGLLALAKQRQAQCHYPNFSAYVCACLRHEAGLIGAVYKDKERTQR